MTRPLARNRDYQLLWASQALSLFGFNASTIAFPLLTLTVTGSAAASGLVLGIIATAQLVAGLPAGALVDRWNRKAVMLACEAAQALAAASLVVAALIDAVTLGQLVLVAAVVGLCAALFEPAEDASLPQLVADEQLSTAVAMNAARGSLGQLAGTGAGGFLFAIGRFLPFLVDAVAHAVATVAIAFVRLPARHRVPDRAKPHLAREMAAGVRWVWSNHDIRVTTLCAVVLNLFFSGFYIVVLVVARSRGVPAGEIGLMAAMLGAGGLVGALLAPALTRRLSPYACVLSVFWTLTLLTPVAAAIHNGLLLGGLFFLLALLPPTANTTIVARQLLRTPDELRGRLTGVLGLAMGVAAALGPLLGGLLMETVSGGAAVLVCSAGIALVTVVAAVNPTLRALPPAAFSTTPFSTTPFSTTPFSTTPSSTTPLSTTEVSTTEVSTTQVSTGRESTMDDNARYEVLRNDEDQYSLWLAGHEVPAGWHRVGKEGTKEECSAYVDEVWTDMRPRSLRERMGA